MDLIYTNAKRVDQGVLSAFAFDLSFGASENDFEMTVGKSEAVLEPGAFVYMEGTEYGGIVDGRKTRTSDENITYKGRTWHGILNSKVIVPATEDDFLAQSFTITAYVTGGTVDPASATVRKGGSQTFTFTPNAGYEVESVLVDGVAIDIESFADVYTFEDVKAEHTISVVYVEPSLLPDGYTQLEYIQSNGTPYINSGFNPNQDTRVVCEYSAVSISGNAGGLFGSRISKGNLDYAFWHYGYPQTDGYSQDDYNTSIIANILRPSGRTIIDKNKNVTTINGTAFSHTYTTFSCSYPLFIFAVNTNGSKDSQVATFRIYSFQIYDNGTIVRNLYPAKNSNGTIGMYDIVNNVFYTNAGSGTFTAGPEYEAASAAVALASVEPAAVESYSVEEYAVEIKQEDSDGNSMIGRYLVISGDANDCIQFLIERLGLSGLFEAASDVSGVNISNYQFSRYCKAYDGLKAMLASSGAKLKITWEEGAVLLSAAPIVDYTDAPVDGDIATLTVEQHNKKVNHLICLGRGELEEREVLHLYVDSSGGIGDVQYFVGLDEILDTYENSNTESSEELRKEGTKRLKELRDNDKAEIALSETDGLSYDIGDIVGATELNSGVSVAATVTQKIVKITNGAVSTEYKTGG